MYSLFKKPYYKRSFYAANRQQKSMMFSFTYRNCSKLVFQITVGPSYHEQKFENLTKIRHKVDWLQKDKPQQSMPQLGELEHLGSLLGHPMQYDTMRSAS